ncbi:MAG: hypothetical protein R3F11_08955 [Verrucomicrobiales bacterium]
MAKNLISRIAEAGLKGFILVFLIEIGFAILSIAAGAAALIFANWTSAFIAAALAFALLNRLALGEMVGALLDIRREED